MKANLRQRQRELTRELIIDAIARIIVKDGAHGFSMEEVADAAGVSLRTLYRYFPSREDLLCGVGELLTDKLVAAERPPVEGTLQSGLAALRHGFEVFGAHEHLARATVILVGAAERKAGLEDDKLWTRLTDARRERHAAIRAMVDERLPALTPAARAQIFATTRLLCSIVGWDALTGDAMGLDSRDAAVAAEWAIRTLVARASEMAEAGITTLEEDLE